MATPLNLTLRTGGATQRERSHRGCVYVSWRIRIFLLDPAV